MVREFSPRSGLSLLELLVSLALLALIGAGLAGAFGLGNQLWTRSSTLGEHAQEIALRRQLRTYLNQALPPTRLTPFNASFSGDQAGFSFITLAQTPFAPDAAAMRMRVSARGDRLVLTTELLGDDGEVQTSLTDILARNAANIRFSYFDHASPNPSWISNWLGDTELPNLVRIQVDEGSAPPWPEFIVKLALQ